MDDGLNFTGDTENVTIAKKLNETLSITGGITKADQLTAEDNIGVVASDSGLKVRLAKDLQDSTVFVLVVQLKMVKASTLLTSL